MEIKTSVEVWQEVPYDDKEDVANNKQWVSVDSQCEYLEKLATNLKDSDNPYVQGHYDCLNFIIQILNTRPILNPAHTCHCGRAISGRGFCCKECHDKYYDDLVKEGSEQYEGSLRVVIRV